MKHLLLFFSAMLLLASCSVAQIAPMHLQIPWQSPTEDHILLYTQDEGFYHHYQLDIKELEEGTAISAPLCLVYRHEDAVVEGEFSFSPFGVDMDQINRLDINTTGYYGGDVEQWDELFSSGNFDILVSGVNSANFYKYQINSFELDVDIYLIDVSPLSGASSDYIIGDFYFVCIIERSESSSVQEDWYVAEIYEEGDSTCYVLKERITEIAVDTICIQGESLEGVFISEIYENQDSFCFVFVDIFSGLPVDTVCQVLEEVQQIQAYNIYEKDTVFKSNRTADLNGNFLKFTNGSLEVEGLGGSFGTTDPGTRMAWLPNWQSFRAEQITSSDISSTIGTFSVVFGQDNEATGLHSTAIGRNNVVENGSFGIAMGENIEISGFNALGIGKNINSLGNNNFNIGEDLDNVFGSNVLIGHDLELLGTSTSNYIIGFNNSITGNTNLIFGLGNTLTSNATNNKIIGSTTGEITFSGINGIGQGMSFVNDNQTVVGNYNILHDDEFDRRFTVGVGSSSSQRRDAYTIFRPSISETRHYFNPQTNTDQPSTTVKINGDLEITDITGSDPVKLLGVDANGKVTEAFNPNIENLGTTTGNTDIQENRYAILTMGGNHQLRLLNPFNGFFQEVTVEIRQGATAYVPTWSSLVKFPDNTPPTLSGAFKKDLLSFVWNGTHWLYKGGIFGFDN